MSVPPRRSTKKSFGEQCYVADNIQSAYAFGNPACLRRHSAYRYYSRQAVPGLRRERTMDGGADCSGADIRRYNGGISYHRRPSAPRRRQASGQITRRRGERTLTGKHYPKGN